MAPNDICVSDSCTRKPSSNHPYRASHQPSIHPEPRGRDLYGRITDQIIAAIEAGTGAWRMPWHHTGAATSRPTNAVTGRKYRGINTLALWAAAEAAGYPQGLWATYAQWHAAGAQVHKGERATTVVLWKELTGAQASEPDQDTDEPHRRVVARAFSVFNSAQVSGFEPTPTPVLPETERLAQAEAFIAHLGIPTTFGGAQACYQPATDTVLLPPFAQFRDAVSFYATWLHECGHATGAQHRLARDLTGRFGSVAYALEEITVLSGQSAPAVTLH